MWTFILICVGLSTLCSIIGAVSVGIDVVRMYREAREKHEASKIIRDTEGRFLGRIHGRR